MADLTDEHRNILEFERGWWRYPGAKDAAIRERFGLSSTQYYSRLNWLINQPEALQLDPMLVRRLRRLRAARAELRASSRLGFRDARFGVGQNVGQQDAP